MSNRKHYTFSLSAPLVTELRQECKITNMSEYIEQLLERALNSHRATYAPTTRVIYDFYDTITASQYAAIRRSLPVREFYIKKFAAEYPTWSDPAGLLRYLKNKYEPDKASP